MAVDMGSSPRALPLQPTLQIGGHANALLGDARNSLRAVCELYQTWRDGRSYVRRLAARVGACPGIAIVTAFRSILPTPAESPALRAAWPKNAVSSRADRPAVRWRRRGQEETAPGPGGDARRP